MGYKYKGNLAYGKNGTSWRFRDNKKHIQGNSSLRESQDLFSKDDDRRENNPNSSNGLNFRPNYIGWVEEVAPSQVSSRKAAQSTLTYDSKTLPRIIIDDKDEFDRLLADGSLRGVNIPIFYRSLKYPSTFEEIYPYNFLSSFIFRQEGMGTIKSGFDNSGSNSQIEKTGFFIDGTFQWGIPAIINPSIQLTSPIRLTHAIYANGGFNKTFTFKDKNFPFYVEPTGVFKFHPVNYNMRNPEGSSLSYLIQKKLIKGTPKETLFSGHRESRISNSLGL